MADVQIAIIDQENTQIALAAPSETSVNIAVPGIQGVPGPGVPTGGTANQVLFKQSGTNYDTAWSTVTSAMIGDLQIADADVSATAAIAGTKIAPNFGSQTVQTTGVFSHALGTAAAPTVTFTGDPNTGLYSPGADQVAISTNGTGRLFVDSLGLVSIGDSGQLVIGKGESAIPTNSVKAHIFWGLDSIYGGTSGDLIMMPRSSAAANLRIYTGSTTPSERFRITGTGQLSHIGAGSAVSPAVSFNGGAPSNSFVITSAGLVGIGTSSPTTTLQVGNSTGLKQILIAGGGYDLILGTSGGAIFGYTTQSISTVFNTAAVPLGVGTSSTQPLILGTSNTERARITSDGKVGIGTSSPDALLTVNGVGAFGAGSAAAPSIAITGDLNTGIYSPGADQLAISTGGTGRVFVDATGRVGVGNSSPAGPLDIAVGGVGPARIIASQTSDNPYLDFYRSTGVGSNFAGFRLSTPSISGELAFSNAPGAAIGSHVFTERFRCDSSGRLLVGTSVSREGWYTSTNPHTVQVESAGYTLQSWTANNAINSETGAYLSVARCRGAAGTYTVVNSGDMLGRFAFHGADGSKFVESAFIEARVDGTPGANDMPGRLVFSTTADGAATPTERLRITSAGNVGIGTSSPGYLLEVSRNTSGDAVAFTASTDRLRPLVFSSSDNTASGAVWTRKIDSAYGTHAWAINGTERVRIDSSGRLLVGTSTALTNIYTGATATTPQIQLSGAGLPESSLSLLRTGTTGATVFLNAGSSGNNVIADSITGRLIFNGYDGTNYRTSAQITAEVDGTPGANDMPGRLVFSTTADGAASPTERMRINSVGKILIGQTSTYAACDGWLNVTYTSASTAAPTLGLVNASATAVWVSFSDSATVFGSITRSGSSTVYATSSDYRLKENVAPVTDGITRLQQLKPSRFNFIADPDKTVDGFIAHEVQTIVPEAITGEKDAVDDEGNPVYQGIDQSKLVPLLTAALQEAIGEIESLKARLDAANL